MKLPSVELNHVQIPPALRLQLHMLIKEIANYDRNMTIAQKVEINDYAMESYRNNDPISLSISKTGFQISVDRVDAGARVA